jgi:hypothetical protein
MNAFRPLPSMVRKYQICTTRHILEGKKTLAFKLLLELFKVQTSYQCVAQL